MELRDYQRMAVVAIKEFLYEAQPNERRMYVAPCGTGKSLIEVEVQRALPGAVILTPRQEIIDGLIEKGGDAERIYTPVTYRNRLLEGARPPASYLLVDEGHHDTCNTAREIRLCLGDAPTVAFTATPYRGTPQGTAALRELYGEPHYILSLKESIDYGYSTLPTCQTVPILDDDIVEISGGEFKVRTVEAKTPWQAAAVLVHVVCKTPRPTVVSLPSVSAVAILAEALTARGIDCACVTGDTSRTEREWAFQLCIAEQRPLLQVQVVSEGVDLPLRRLIDFAPTLSPVRWLQQLGRIMRPSDTAPEYICANRNLLRHGYLLEGLLPSSAYAIAQAAFPQASRREGSRAFGLECLGRLKPCRVPLANGLYAAAYYVTRAEGHRSIQYCAIVLPSTPTPLWASRVNGSEWGKWGQCEAPSELKGFASVPPRPISVKQRAWWERDAAKYGLDAVASVDAKVFAVLPVLANTRRRIQ